MPARGKSAASTTTVRTPALTITPTFHALRDLVRATPPRTRQSSRTLALRCGARRHRPRDARALALGQRMPNPRHFPPPDEWLRRFATLPLMQQPGEQWIYNTGADVLGVRIARASNQAFPDFLRERIFVCMSVVTRTGD